jgi:hypothetical protein
MGHLAGVPPDDRKIERTIVFQLLRDDHEESWSRAELASTCRVEAAQLDAALQRLCELGIAIVESDGVQASGGGGRD